MVATTQVKQSNYNYSISIIGVLFFIFGFVTWLNGTLIPFLKIACELTSFQALFVAFAFYISYFVMAIPSSWLLHKVGFKNGMVYGLIIMAIGSLVFVPAAMMRYYGLFLVGLFIQGTGLALLQTASNPYITILGPIESAAQRISIMGICNKIAGVLSPLVLGYIVLKNVDSIIVSINTLTGDELVAQLDALSQRVILPYIVMAVVLVGLALMLRLAHLPDIETDNIEINDATNGSKKTSLFQFPQLVFGFVALFGYVGVEVIAGDTIALYGQSQGIALSTARIFTSYTLSSMIVGYIIGIFFIPRFFTQAKALAVSAVLGILFSIIAVLTSGFTSVLFIALLGLANALMWPAIWPLAISDLGKFTKSGSALLIMGIAGGATLPLVYGLLADHFNHQQAYWMLVPIYMFILFYSTKGYKMR